MKRLTPCSEILNRISILSRNNLPSCSVTVAAEPDTRVAPLRGRVGVRIGVTVVADGTLVLVPVAVRGVHEAARVRPRMSPLDAIRVGVAERAHRVTSVLVVAGGTDLDILPREIGMPPTG